MLWVSYGRISQEGVKGILDKPTNRAEAVGKLLEAYGGKLIHYYMVMNGDIDFIIINEIADDKIADATFVNALLVRGYGAIENITTLPVVEAENAMPYMEKAGKMAAEIVYQSLKK